MNQRSLETVAALAVEYETCMVFGTTQRQKVESVVYSAAVAVDPQGKVIADYQKVHLRGEQGSLFGPAIAL